MPQQSGPPATCVPSAVKTPSRERPPLPAPRNAKTELAGKYYQFLSGHIAIGSYLRNKIHKVDNGQMLVLRYRRAAIQIPPHGQLPDFGRPGARHVEEDSEAMWKQGAGVPVGTVHIRSLAIGPHGVDFFKGHQYGNDNQDGSSGPERGKEEHSEDVGGEGWPSPPENVLSFLTFHFLLFLFSNVF